MHIVKGCKRYIALSFITLVISIVIHAPIASNPVRGIIDYSDLISIFNNRIMPHLEAELVSNGTNYVLYIHEKAVDPCGLPYVDYFFEYPTVSAGVFYASSCLGKTVASMLTSGETPNQVTTLCFYAIISAFLGVFFMLSVCFFARVAELSNVLGKRVLLYVLSPSMVVYLIYNFDIIAVALMLVALYCYMRDKLFWSGLFFGLSVSAKIIPVAVAYVVFLMLLRTREWRKILKYALGGVVGVAPLMLHAVLNPGSLLPVYNYVSSWYCENCIYMWFEPNIFSPLHKVIFLVIGSATAVATAAYVLKSRTVNIYVAMLTAVYAVTVFNYINPPQYYLLILPLALLVIPSGSVFSYPLLLVSDVLNASFIAMFITDSIIRGLLGQTPLYAPWHPRSIAQPFYLERNILLILFLLLCIRKREASRVWLSAQR
ncbi:MAG: glycosyltransferase family 87 protein [Zestosphaera sp.]